VGRVSVLLLISPGRGDSSGQAELQRPTVAPANWLALLAAIATNVQTENNGNRINIW
jgi:hypothetical protein